jgi:hypothetical protein
LRTFRYRSITGSGRILARFHDAAPLLTRATSADGPAYFCATLPHPSYSTLATDGVLFYVMMQRALSVGSATLGNARQWEAGSSAARQVADWTPLSERSEPRLASTRSLLAGVYAKGQQRAALNRPRAEDTAPILPAAEIEPLFQGLDFRQVTDRLADPSPLASEIWRDFLLVMAAALLVEAGLSLPSRQMR